jgi:hypothetical protein
LSTDEALAEPTSDDLLHSYPGTVSIFLCYLITSRQRDFAGYFMSACPIHCPFVFSWFNSGSAN